MNVKELIEHLEQLPPEAEVHIAYNSGDYWRTVVAPKVDMIEELPIKHSDYHNKPVLVSEEDDDYNNNEFVVVIR